MPCQILLGCPGVAMRGMRGMLECSQLAVVRGSLVGLGAGWRLGHLASVHQEMPGDVRGYTGHGVSFSFGVYVGA